ncbi:hypothetical protein [Herbaspirillum frisingense]|uniref:hypothetical protein n=1 Tax=Herbaspirillum frisingense TaxID=92645 RepID=UPI001F285942|nr:hypothetical protein [Herbaspirillum frisingense]UIN20699.1 hypothetical protein LAZ82_19855 [Herbaspirillum frisingense]
MMDMIVAQENILLKRCCLEAGNFLALEIRERASSEWFLSIQRSPDARTFFKRTVLSKGVVLQVSAVTAVANSFLSCCGEDVRIPPAKSEVDSLQHQAAALKSQLDKAGRSWLIPEARSQEFQVPLARLAEAPSTVAPRGAGRLPNLPRRSFVLHLAESLYGLVDDFPVRFIAGVAAQAWEETDERQVREILSNTEREKIKAQIQLKRKSAVSAEVDTHLLISRLSVAKRIRLSASPEKTDAARLLEMLELAKGMADSTAASTLIGVLNAAATELGMRPNENE